MMSDQKAETVLAGAHAAGVATGAPDPGALLREALELTRDVRKTKGDGWWADTLVFLRIAGTLRLHGLREEALEAIRDCTAHNVRINDGALRDEISIELCRMLVFLGEVEEAFALAGTATFRNYDLVALYTIASTALENGDSETGERAIRSAVSTVDGRQEGEENHGDDMWVRGLVRLATRMGRLDLARELLDGMTHELWKSGAAGDLSVALGRQGETEEAVQVAAGCPDPYMAVLACARVGSVFSGAGKPEALAGAVEALFTAASGVTQSEARDAAFRIATQMLATSGAFDAAARVAAEIRDPCMSVLARCVLLTPENFDAIVGDIQQCPDAEKPLVAEALTVACGAKGLRAEAQKASERVAWGWPRLRALCEAARWLMDRGLDEEAVVLLDRASDTTAHIDGAGWLCLAHLQLAARYHRAGREAEVDAHLRAADAALLKVDDADDFEGIAPRFVEAALEAEREDLAREVILRTLRPGMDGALRDRLVPMLVQAGDSEAALAECARAPLGGAFTRRLVAYRLAEAGETERAIEYASTLKDEERAEALADIVLVPLRKDGGGAPAGPKVVGVTLHGSWRSWFPRLERLSIEWELMPFSEPYELGPEGLAAKYSMLGFPGTGSHLYHVSMAGIESLREYLYGGGGLFGICAGQFLATGAQFVPTKEVYHPRGQGPHQVQIVKQHPISFSLPSVVVIPRMNGGFLEPVPGCEVVGWYDTVGRYAALAATNYGWGRVVAFSPHPEGSSGFIPRDRLCISAMYWTLGGMP